MFPAGARYVAPVLGNLADGTRWIGGLVPHAGWICSGAIAGETIAALAAAVDAQVVVVFGAIHTPLTTAVAVLDRHDRWLLPGGGAQIAQPLQAQLATVNEFFAVDERFHQSEHAVEVEVPLIKAAWPEAVILPVEVPPLENAVTIGQRTAREVLRSNLRAVYLASSDLTHYGPNYRFTPAGVGPAAMRWAKENDQRLLQLVTDMQAEHIVPQVRARLNACGAGAIAAMLAACREHGATHGRLLRHANSYETLSAIRPRPATDAVGYAAMVIG